MTVRPMVGFAIALLVIAGGILLVRRRHRRVHPA